MQFWHMRLIFYAVSAGLKVKRCSKKEVVLPELPDPSGSLSKDMPLSSIAAANEVVKAEILDCHQDSKKRGQYIKLTPAQ